MYENKAQGRLAGGSGLVLSMACSGRTPKMRLWLQCGRCIDMAGHQRRTCSAPGLTMLVGVPLMKLMTLSKAAPKYNS